MFIFLVALSALFVAGCAAYFSIFGLTVLFAGSAVSVAIMASSLEFGKLVAASFLHRYWHEISWMLKTYLCLAVLVLMAVTSLGIFGFLTNAYQQHASLVNGMEVSSGLVLAKKKSKQEALAAAEQRIKLLSEQRTIQEQRVKDAKNFKAPRDAAYLAITEANKEIAEKEQIITAIRTDVTILDEEEAKIAGDLATRTDVGSFKFIAGALDVSVDEAVRYFILALVFVFDPLAVCLILALNIMLEKRLVKTQPVSAPVVNPAIIRTDPAIVPEPIKPVIVSVVPEEEPLTSNIADTTPVVMSEVADVKAPEEESPYEVELGRRRRAGLNDSVVTS